MWFTRKVPKSDLELETSFERLKLKVASLELSYEDLAGRVKRLYSAQRRDKQEEEVSPQDEPATEPANNGPGGFLSPRQKLIQQQILMRRAGLKP